VSVRDRLDGDLGAKPVAEVIEMLKAEVAQRKIRSTSSATASFEDKGAKFAD
jgi:hypothetical protein